MKTLNLHWKVMLFFVCIAATSEAFAYRYSNTTAGPRAYLKMSGSGNDLRDQFSLCFYLNPACLASREALSVNGDFARESSGDHFYAGAAVPVGFGAIGVAGGGIPGSLQSDYDLDVNYGLPLNKIVGLGLGVNTDGKGMANGKIGAKMDFPMKKSKSDGFAFQNLSIGIALLNVGQPVISDDSEYPFTVRSSFQFQFTNWRYFKSFAHASFEAANHFREIYISPGLFFNVLRFFEIGFSWRGRSYLVQNTGYGLFGVKVSLLWGEAVVRYSTTLDPGTQRDHLVYTQFSYHFESQQKMIKQAAELEIPIIYFSPDGDGIKDFAEAENYKFKNERITDWCAYIKNKSGEVIRTYCSDLVKNAFQLIPAPEKITWDGYDQKGTIVADNTYTAEYVRKGLDTGIKTDTVAFLISSKKKIDGKTSLEADPTTPNTYSLKHITEEKREIRWRAVIIDERQKILREIALPKYQNVFSLKFSSTGISEKDAATAKFVLQGEDKAGNKYRFEKKIESVANDLGRLILARTQTHIQLGDGSTSLVVSVSARNAEIVELIFTFHRADGAHMKEIRRAYAEQVRIDDVALRWYNPGDVLLLKATGIDKKGNQYNSNSLDYEMIRNKNLLSITHQPGLFELSPESSKLIRFIPARRGRLTLVNWTIEIFDASGHLFNTLKGEGDLPPEISWNGKNGTESLEPLSTYKYKISAQDVMNHVYTSALVELRTGVYLKEATGFESLDGVRSISLRIPSVLFTAGSSGISREFRSKLSDVVRKLRLYPQYAVVIEGYTDNIGGEEYNLALSRQRADVIKKVFIEEGLPPARIVTIGYGQSRPIAENESEEGRAKNRRVEIILTPQAGG